MARLRDRNEVTRESHELPLMTVLYSQKGVRHRGFEVSLANDRADQNPSAGAPARSISGHQVVRLSPLMGGGAGQCSL